QNIDFIGIDNYMPLSDWRDNSEHLDRSLADGPYDRDYLQSNIRGGEGYDWFYASDADRLSQARTDITDGTYNEPWVFRYKDLWSWWSNPHEERLNGVKIGISSWVPQSKPIRFTELGGPSVDKGPNQPNVFLDPKSSESAPPYFSSGGRDDRAQRGLVEAQLSYWADPANNLVSSIYGGPMVDPDRIYIYAWDARPYPEFPARSEIWADTDNWVTGHWINGRAGRIRLSVLIETLAREAGVDAVDASACDQLVSGLIIPEPATARAAIEPLLDLYQLDAFMRGGMLIVRPRDGVVQATVDEDDLVLIDGASLDVKRAQDEELPAALAVTYTDELSGYELKATEARDETIANGRTMRIGTAVVLEQGEAEARARSILAEARVMRYQAQFALPEIADGLEPSSVVRITTGTDAFTVRLTRVQDQGFRTIEAVSTDEGVFGSFYTGLAADPASPPVTFGTVVFEALDIPLLPEGATEAHLWFAAFAEPWPGAVNVFRGEGTGAPFVDQLTAQSLIGRLVDPLPAGPLYRWDRTSVLRVSLSAGSLSSVPEADVLEGAHLCAVRSSSGAWEVMQFARAELLPDGTWRLMDLLRGRRGTEAEALAGAPANARFVLLSDAAARPLSPDRWGTTETFQSGPASAPPGAYPYRSASFALSGTGARPFSPVQPIVQRTGDNFAISWLRRTRIGGDFFGVGDVPLGESTESYEIQVLASDDTVLQTLNSTVPSVSFSEPLAAKVTIAQRSLGYGVGRSLSVML
ncbi:MAG: glycoside hydrolase TIM-barrel-like domain-containing protein, partial [Pseudomonadota bacterium]